MNAIESFYASLMQHIFTNNLPNKKEILIHFENTSFKKNKTEEIIWHQISLFGDFFLLLKNSHSQMAFSTFVVNLIPDNWAFVVYTSLYI